MSRVFLITGTRKGIGRGLAEHYLAEGEVVVGCSRKASDLEHPNYCHYTLDVADEAPVRRMVREVVKERGGIDVLLNNAGAASMNHLLSTPIDTVQRIFSVNFLGGFLLTREVGKAMSKRRHGSIVNFSTVAVPLRVAGEAAYAASKAALVSFTQVAAKELAPFGVRINAVGPTPVETDLIKFVPKDKIQGLLDQQAIPRFGQLSDVINVIDFFISPQSDFITGQVIYLGGVFG